MGCLRTTSRGSNPAPSGLAARVVLNRRRWWLDNPVIASHCKLDDARGASTCRLLGCSVLHSAGRIGHLSPLPERARQPTCSSAGDPYSEKSHLGIRFDQRLSITCGQQFGVGVIEKHCAQNRWTSTPGADRGGRHEKRVSRLLPRPTPRSA